MTLNDDNQYFHLKTLSTGSNLYDDTTIVFTVPLHLDNDRNHIHSFAVKKITIPQLNLINCPATTLNISVAGVPHVLSLTQAGYDIGSLSTAINDYLTYLNLPAIYINPDFSDVHVRISLPPTYKIDFSLSPVIGELLGFGTSTIDNSAGVTTTTYEGSASPSFDKFYDASGNRLTVDNIYLHCSLINRVTFCNLDQDEARQNNNGIVLTFAIDTMLNNGFTYEPQNLVYLPLGSRHMIDTIRFYLTNQDNKPLRGVFRSPIYISAHLKRL